MKPSRFHRVLRLESLESRALLAGDLFGLDADLAAVAGAVSGTGSFELAFEPRFGNQQIVVTGSSGTDLTIDFSELPDFVSILSIASFDTVTVVGERTLDRVLINDVNFLNAPDLSLTNGVYADAVDAIRLDSAGMYALLKGEQVVLEVEHLDQTLVFADLDLLKIDSASEQLSIVSANSDTVVDLVSKPSLLVVSGLNDVATQVHYPGSALPPPTDGTDTPGTPTEPGEPGGNPDPDDDIIVVTLPLDEQLSEFLAAVRQFMQGNIARPVNGPAFDLAPVNEAVAVSADPRVLLSRPAGDNVDQSGNASRAEAQETDSLETSPDHRSRFAMPLPLGELELLHLAEMNDQAQPLPLPFVAQGALGGAMPVPEEAVPLHQPRMVQDKLSVDPLPGTADLALLVVQLDELRPSVGDYIMRRVSAELQPGQRDAVLLSSPRLLRASPLDRERIFSDRS